MKITVKIVSFFLVLLLFGAMPTTLSADKTTVTATVVAGNSPVYTIEIPAEISADDLQRADVYTGNLRFLFAISDIQE